MKRFSASLLVVVAALVVAPAATEGRAPSAFDLLDRVRAAYETLERYEDGGTIAIDGSRRWRFDTAYDASTGFLLRLDDARSGERAGLFWKTEDGEFAYDAERDVGEPVQHLLSQILSRVGSGGRFGLAPAALLLQGSVGIPEPDGASVDGPLPCADADPALAGAGSCFVLSGGALGGTVLFELWISEGDSRILFADVEAFGASEMASRGAVDKRRVQVTYEASRLDPPVVDVSPGASERTRARTGTRADAGSAGTSMPDPAARGSGPFGETIDVRLSSLRVRALDPSGFVMDDLKPEELELRVNGEVIAVEALEWVESASPQIDLPPEILAREGIVVAPPGKLVIFFVQADLEPSRAYGQLRLMPRVRELIDSLGRDDRMAVVSYDSHLKLRHDFSRDRDAVHEAIKSGIVYSDAERIEPGRFPSLARYLDYDEARKVAQPEDALEMTARALQRLPGEKVMVFLGFGLGRFTGGGVLLGNRYDKAAERLAIARVTVFTLDVTQADAHSLEVGLRQVSADTGGAYYRTFRFPDVAVKQVAKAIAGHWVVYFHEPVETEERARKRHVKVKLKGRKGSILVAPTG